MITESPEPGRVSRRYRAATRWDGLRWTVSIEDPNGHDVEATASAGRLAEVADVAKSVVGGIVGERGSVRGVDVAVDVLLPPAVELALERVTVPLGDGASIVDEVLAALSGLSMPSDDIATALNRRLAPADGRRLFVTNAEVVAHGLDNWREVIAVRCGEYRSKPLTYCQVCVDTDRRPWIERPQGLSILIYDPPMQCDGCCVSVTRRGAASPQSWWSPGDVA